MCSNGRSLEGFSLETNPNRLRTELRTYEPKLRATVHKSRLDRRPVQAIGAVETASRDENDKCKNICKRQYQISRNSGLTREPYLTGAAFGLCLRCGLRAMILLQVSMILVGDKIESVTREVGLLDAVVAARL
ncbi:hypothetical protein L2E82_49523 [Cichorium intybus]|uniref:Uncharacterized protein n=1 Tax=Cichorium intybus TaxID=13427 RepID=A0ACB8YZU2_CICIN|nr:hypothetical protein L2E82_49523 [Cichorium intybus]